MRSNPGNIDWSDAKDPEPILFSRGSHLSDVPDHYHGISRRSWLLKQIREQCSEYLRALPANAPTPLAEKALATPRDNYGYRSL